MPYIPTTITHMSANLSLGSRELYAYRYTVSGGQVTPAGVKSVTAGTGVSIAGGSNITSTGVINISAGSNVTVATAAILPSGTRTTITGTLGGATTGTPQFYQDDFATADGSPLLYRRMCRLPFLRCRRPRQTTTPSWSLRSIRLEALQRRSVSSSRTGQMRAPSSTLSSS